MINLEPRQRKWVRARITILTSLLLLGAVLIVRRAYELQITRGAVLREMAEDQYLRDIRLTPKRGTIYDRHGAELAVSVDAESIYANPREMRASGRSPAEVAALLATVLPINGPRVVERLGRDRYFVWIKRRVSPAQAAAVRALAVPGVGQVYEPRRYYPNRELAAHLLGFANVDGVGIEGLELSLEERLRGSVAEVPAIRDRRGAVVFSEQLLDDRAAQGDDVYLTIDKAIQHIAERELALAVRTFEARAGSVIVQDPRSGEILAMANYPSFNPNHPGSSPPSHRRNRAVTDRFEPGSTVKPFTVAGAIAAGTIGAEQLIDCENGAMEVGEFVIHDSHPFGMLTPAQILAHSSNIGTAKIGATLTRRGLFRVFRRFGFGERTGLPVPGETAGILRHYRRWYEMDAATISFGQGVSVTNVQLATAMSVIANGGRLMRPTLVRRISDAGGETVEVIAPRVRRRVVRAQAARLVADMLTAVTGPDGTGPEAAIAGYLVAGKTGTAQKADYVAGGYAEDRWLASFTGFVPAEDPRLVISVVIDEPVIAHYGGVVAGPVFRRIGEASLRHLGVPATTSGRLLLARRRARPSRVQADAATAELEAAPHPEAPPAAVTERVIEEGETRVPDLTGRTARRVMVEARAAALQVRLRGTGFAASQTPAPGEVVPRGSAILVTLAPADVDRTPLVDDTGAALAAVTPAQPSRGGQR